jgi:hypothetical protein
LESNFPPRAPIDLVNICNRIGFFGSPRWRENRLNAKPLGGAKTPEILVQRARPATDITQLHAAIVLVLVLFCALWLGCALAIARNSSLHSCLRYLDAALLMPALLTLLALNLRMSWRLTPWLVELTGAVSDTAGTLAAPLAFLVCAPLPILGFIFWRKWIRSLDRHILMGSETRHLARHCG